MVQTTCPNCLRSVKAGEPIYRSHRADYPAAVHDHHGRANYSPDAYNKFLISFCGRCLTARVKRSGISKAEYLKNFVQRSFPCDGCKRTINVDANCWQSGVLCYHCHRSVRFSAHDYCTPQCRQERINARARERHAERRKPRACEVCRTVFKPQRDDGRYCSVTCRVRAHRKRRAGA
jgi:hypothetical protein